MSNGLLGDLEKKKNIVEGKNKKQKKEKEVSPQKNNTGESEKVNRSYMLSKATLSKLQEMKIKEADKTFSDIVEEAINTHYKTNFK